MDFSDITYTREGAAAVVRFDRPERLNAARSRTHVELRDALGRAEADEGVRAVILAGEGRAFCAGTDIGGGFDLPSGGDPATGEGVPPDIGGETILRVFAMRKPVLAAIHGPAVGFGASLTLACDQRLAGPGARWGFVFSRRGIAAESCSSWFLPRIVGLPTALDWMLSGRLVEVEEARATGLVSRFAQTERLLPEALAWVEELARETAPASVAINRQLLWRMAGAAHPAEAHTLESRAVAARLAHPDSVEGVAAFTERRSPVFPGRIEDAAFMDAWWGGEFRHAPSEAASVEPKAG